jgi:hypothetical protein
VSQAAWGGDASEEGPRRGEREPAKWSARGGLRSEEGPCRKEYKPTGGSAGGHESRSERQLVARSERLLATRQGRRGRGDLLGEPGVELITRAWGRGRGGDPQEVPDE